jgi:hypothetical protein
MVVVAEDNALGCHRVKHLAQRREKRPEALGTRFVYLWWSAGEKDVVAAKAFVERNFLVGSKEKIVPGPVRHWCNKAVSGQKIMGLRWRQFWVWPVHAANC